MNKKLLKIIIISVIVLLVIILDIIGVKGIIRETEKNLNKVNEPNKLKVYKNGKTYCNYDEIKCNKYAFEIDALENSIVITGEDDYVLYMDNTFHLYNTTTKQSKTLSQIPSNYEYYKLIRETNEDTTSKSKLVGITYANLLDETKDKEKLLKDCNYYDLTTNNNKYNNYCIINKKDNYYEGYNNIVYNENNIKYNLVLINDKNDSVIIENETTICSDYKVYDNYIIYEHNNCFLKEANDVKYYTKTAKPINNELIKKYKISLYNNNYYIKENDSITKYAINGNIISEKSFNDYYINAIYNNYVIASKNNKMYIINLDTQEETELFELKNYYTFDPLLSGYYDNIDNKNLENYDKGYYIIITYEVNDYETNAGIEYYYNKDTKEIKKNDIISLEE